MEVRFFEVKLVRSPIGLARRYREVLKGMGLRRVGTASLLKDTPQVRGMIFKMSHMLEIKKFKSENEYKKFRNSAVYEKEMPVIVELPKKAPAKPKREEKDVKISQAADSREASQSLVSQREDEPLEKTPSLVKTKRGTRREGTAVTKKRVGLKKSSVKKSKGDAKK